MADQQLIDWIKAVMGQGWTTQQVYSYLLQQGYKPEQATEAINQATLPDMQAPDHSKFPSFDNLPVSPVVLVLGTFFVLMVLAGLGFVLFSGGPSEAPFDMSSLSQRSTPAAASSDIDESDSLAASRERVQEDIIPEPSTPLARAPAPSIDSDIESLGAELDDISEDEFLQEDTSLDDSVNDTTDNTTLDNQNNTAQVNESAVVAQVNTTEETEQNTTVDSTNTTTTNTTATEDTTTDTTNTTTTDTTADDSTTTEDTSDDTTDTTDTVSTGTVHHVRIQNFEFEPASINIEVGDTIVWTNFDSAPHTATETGQIFNTGTLQQGESANFTFNNAGTLSYSCNLHPSMTGIINVGVDPVINDTSTEELPPPPGTILGEGDFVNRANPGQGTAYFVDDSGELKLHLQNFQTTDGPNLHVYLSEGLTPQGAIDLGEVSAELGSYVFNVAENNLTTHNNVLVWCVPFSKLFTSAELS